MQNSSMTEQELLTDLLHSERAAIKEYASNCTESSDMKLRDLLIDCMSECSEDQFAVFEQMKQRALYKTQPAQQQAIATARQEMSALRQQTM